MKEIRSGPRRFALVAAVFLAAGVIVWLVGLGDREHAGESPTAHDPTRATRTRPLLEGRAPEVAARTAGKQGGHLRGRVVDEDRRPLAGIEIRAWVQPDRGYRGPLLNEPPIDASVRAPQVVARTHTDEDGAFRLDGLAWTVRYWIAAIGEPPRHGSRLVATPMPGADSNLVFVLGRGSALRGRVVDATGEGVRARVRATVPFDSGGARHRSGAWSVEGVETEADGRFVLEAAPNGVVLLTATVPGRAQRNFMPIQTPTRREILVRVSEADAGIVAGRVTDSMRHAVPGALVVVETHTASMGPLQEGTSGMARTDADGRYRIEGLAVGEVQAVTVAAAGYVASDLCLGQNLRVTADAVVPFDVVLVCGLVVEGRVVDEAGRGLPGTTVRIAPAGRPLHGWHHIDLSATSTANGSFRITGAPLVGGSVTAHLDGFAPATVGYPAGHEGQLRNVRVVLSGPGNGTGRIRGRVIGADDEPVGRATIRAAYVPQQGHAQPANWYRTAVSAADGAFVVEGLAAGTQWSVSAHMERASSAPVRVALDAGGAAAEATLRLRPVATIHVTVLDAAGDVVPGVGVTRAGSRRTTDATGRCGFSVAPGTHTLQVLNAFGAPTGAPVDVLVRGGEERAVEMRLVGMRSLSGVLVDRSGEPVSGKYVSLKGVRGGGETYTYTDLDGAFAFARIPEGEYAVRVQHQGMPGTYAAGRSDVRLVWDEMRGRRQLIEVIVRDPDGRPVPRGTVWLRSGRSPFNKERTSGSGMRAGGGRFFVLIESTIEDFDIDVQRVQDAAGRPLNLMPKRVNERKPEDSPIHIRLERGLSVKGRIVDSSGKGIAGMAWFLVTTKDGVARPHGPYSGAQHGRTDADGGFDVAGLPPGPVYVTVRPRAPWVHPPTREGRAGEALVITLDRGASVGGRVLDAAGQGVPRAQVRLRLTREAAQAWATLDRVLQPAFVRTGWDATSDAAGRFICEGIPANATVSIEARPPPPLLPASVSDVPAGTDDAIVRVSAGVWIAGTLAWNGWELRDRSIRIHAVPVGAESHMSALADAHIPVGQTTFRIGPLEPGRYSLLFGSHFSPTRVDAEAPSEDVRLLLPKTADITGGVQGRDVGRFTVRFATESGDTSSNTTQTSGVFHIRNDRDVKGTVTVFREGDERFARIENGRPAAGLLKIQLETGSFIAGRIDGLPDFELGKVRIYADSRQVQQRIDVARDGTFRVVGLPPGRYTIRCDLEIAGLVRPVRDVQSGTSDLVLRYEAR